MNLKSKQTTYTLNIDELKTILIAELNCSAHATYSGIPPENFHIRLITKTIDDNMHFPLPGPPNTEIVGLEITVTE